MEQSDKETKKVFEISWFSIFLILVCIGGFLYLGIRFSRLSKQDQQHIATQAVLEAQRDSVKTQADKLAEKVKILEAKVEKANKNTKEAEYSTNVYRKKYNELKNQVPSSPCDTFVILRECEKQLVYSDNYISILKANVLSYSKMSDTLQLENKYLKESYSLCATLSEDQKKELTQVRGKLRRHKIMNFGLVGTLVGVVTVLFLK